jgi:glycosyltransferase involved in cell wall biosynthesis
MRDSMKLRVQHVITSLELGGAQQVLARLVHSTRDSVEQEIITLQPPSQGSHERYAKLGVPIRHAPLKELFRDTRLLTKASRHLERFVPHVVQGWMYHANIAASLMARGWSDRAALIWNVRHAAEAQARDSLRTRALIRGARYFGGAVDAVVFNAERSRLQHEALGYPAGKSHVIPNGFDLERFQIDAAAGESWRVQNGFGEGEILVGHAARFHPVKNHAGLIRAFATAAPANCRLVMVGDGVDGRNAELTSLATTLGCAERVVLRGPEKAMNAFYNAMDLVVLPSFSEALPNVIGEAMCCGTVCVATDVGDAAQLMGPVGWLVEADNQPALQERLAAALALGRKGLAAHAEDCRAQIARSYGLAAMADKYLNLYQELMAGKRR